MTVSLSRSEWPSRGRGGNSSALRDRLSRVVSGLKAWLSPPQDGIGDSPAFYSILLVRVGGKPAGVLAPTPAGLRFAVNGADFESLDGRLFSSRSAADVALRALVSRDTRITYTFLPQT